MNSTRLFGGVEKKYNMGYREIFDEIYQNYGFGGDESRSGPGSTLAETESLRSKIQNLVGLYDIKTVVDIPCGDFNWMKEVVKNFDSYIGGDIVEKCIEENNKKYSNSKTAFVKFDLLNDKIPECDLLIVRDVIGHYPLEDGVKIVNNILRSKCKFLLSTTWYNVVDDSYHEKHKNTGAIHGRFYPVNLMSEPFNLSKPELVLEESVVVDDYVLGNRKVLGFWDLTKIKNTNPNNKTTLVTGLWDIGRDNLSEGWSRSYEHYIEKFNSLLNIDANFIIFGDEKLRKIIFDNKTRTQKNTLFIQRDLNWFKNNSYYDNIQKIRKNPLWYEQAGWLKDSTQAKLEMYNPLVMSKMFLLHDAKLLDKFNSEKLFWIDAGITNTVHPGYFTHDNVLSVLDERIDKFTFICFPYKTTSEIHGFKYPDMCRHADGDVDKVARGGFFGGPKETIKEVNSLYYSLLHNTLDEGLMGTEESLFTILIYKRPDLFQYSEIEGNGLIGTFFENVKNNKLVFKTEKNLKNSTKNNLNMSEKNIGLYVITFNSPKQFETLINSMLEYDKNILEQTTKYLLDNSTDESTLEDYKQLCSKYNFEHIKKDNLGICGGRQFIAEHFAETDHEYMYFFEDDMFFYLKKQEPCKNGFIRYVNNFHENVLRVMHKEEFDFLKLTFTEFFGDNSTQWSWYNVPQQVREEFWPNYCKLPVQGLDPNSPRTVFKNIKSLNGVPYADGEIYYCNWPQIISKKGNKKMFLETKWAHPFEQTWMSYIYQETKKGNIYPGLLLMSPIEHNRFEHYSGDLRREN